MRESDGGWRRRRRRPWLWEKVVFDEDTQDPPEGGTEADCERPLNVLCGHFVLVTVRDDDAEV